MAAAAEETIDELKGYGLRIVQQRHGYRFSLDPLLLADFAVNASASQTVNLGSASRIVDLGSGCGIIPLLLACHGEDSRLVGVECQADLAELARRNVELNGLIGRIEIVQGDVTALRGHFPVSSFDLVTANPPFRPRGSGRISPKAGRDRARHESTATLADFLAMAKYLVRPTGRICIIQHPSRLPDCLATATALKLAMLRLRLVHAGPGSGATMFLVELAKGRRSDLVILPPLFVYAGAGEFSDEMKRIYRENDSGHCL